MRRAVRFSMLCMVLCSALAGAQNERFGGYDVPYVPTDMAVVNEMLSLAEVTGDDMLYDLGCGDGRIVNTAAKEFGTRGVGIDINPVRIEESIANAAQLGVSDKVTFIEQDLFKADFSDATVMTLYLLQSVNLRLRPKLLRDLRPGTRIVSHSFTMDEWEPDDRSEAMSNGYAHRIYYWVVPSNISGHWTWLTGDAEFMQEYDLDVTQFFQKADGTLRADGEPIVVRDLVIDGSAISFVTEQAADGERITCSYTGTVQGDRIAGTVRIRTGSRRSTVSWGARRDPDTVVPLDNFAALE